jgi:hypothetical protein
MLATAELQLMRFCYDNWTHPFLLQFVRNLLICFPIGRGGAGKVGLTEFGVGRFNGNKPYCGLAFDSLNRAAR